MNNIKTEESVPILGFPKYEITNMGRVINVHTKRVMKLSPTSEGILTVGLMYGDRQYRRSVKVLVAKAFVDGETEVFNTPIQLDGDRENLRADNIVWRPRPFAWEYYHQFENPPVWFFSGPILDTVNNIEYKNMMEAAIMNGILCKHIRRSLLNDMRVFPTGQQFVYTKSKRRKTR